MQTLTQYEYLGRDSLLKGVVDWMIEESPIMGKLPFMPYSGNSFKYNVLTSLPNANWLTVGDQISESTGTYEPRYTDIYTLIQEANTDKGEIARNKEQDPELADIEASAKAMADKYETAFVRGQTSTLSSTKEFKGLMRIIAEFESSTTTDLDGPNNSQVVVAAAGATSGAVVMGDIDKLIDQIRPGKPDFLLMSRRARRKVNALQRASGSGVIMTNPAEFGLSLPTYDGIPIFASDYVPDNLDNNSSSVLTIASWDPAKTRTDDYDNTVIFAGKWGEKNLCGLNVGEMAHERKDFVEGYNAIKNRFVWYCGAACFSKYGLACLIGVNPDS